LQDEGLAILEELENFQRRMADLFGLDDEGVPFSEKKAKTSFMRRFAPEGVSTHMTFGANVRALRHIIEMRTAPGAEEEIQLITDQVASIMVAEAPLLFGDYERSDTGVWATE